MRKVLIGVVAVGLGCIDAEAPPASGVLQRGVAAPTCVSQLVRWGTADAELGVALPGPEVAARGPLAVGMRGKDAIVLDNQRQRVVLVNPQGALRTIAEGVDMTAEDVAVGPQGDIAVYSPVRGLVEVFAAAGDRLGQVSVPRSLRHTARVALGTSRRVYAYSGLQERHTLGSPSAPLALDTVVRSKVEGAWRVSDRKGVVAVAADGSAELRVVHDQGDGNRPEVSEVLPVLGHVDAIQIIAGEGAIVCARAETVNQGSTVVEVARRLVCADVGEGRWVMDQPLAEPGLYVPGRELAVARDGAVLRTVSARPTTAGLELNRCEVTL